MCEIMGESEIMGGIVGGSGAGGVGSAGEGGGRASAAGGGSVAGGGGLLGDVACSCAGCCARAFCLRGRGLRPGVARRGRAKGALMWVARVALRLGGKRKESVPENVKNT